MLGYPPDASEILSVIKGLNPDSAPGPDEFTGHFFLSCWDIIHADLVEMIRGFFLGDQLDKKITATSLVLIPKIKNTKGLSDFRPISLGSFSSKIITKIIASRLSRILPNIINEEQFGFVKGRQIHESIALAQKIVSDLDRRVEGGNI